MFQERTHEAREERLKAGTLHVYALNEYAGMLREEPEYGTNGRNGITLVKTPGLRVVLEVLDSSSSAPCCSALWLLTGDSPCGRPGLSMGTSAD